MAGATNKLSVLQIKNLTVEGRHSPLKTANRTPWKAVVDWSILFSLEERFS